MDHTDPGVVMAITDDIDKKILVHVRVRKTGMAA